MRRKEILRTCKRDGTQWFIPRELDTVPPNRMQILGEAHGGIIFNNPAGAARLQDKRDRIIDARRCPACGSSSFKQCKVKI